MPILENQRYELFAQELAKGKSATEAYVLAGYKPSRKNASRLRTKEDIAARVAELQTVAARSAEITIESICRELDEANTVAKERGQASAMVSASALRAKLAGLMVERVEVGSPGSFDDCESVEDVKATAADTVLGDLIESFKPVDQQDRQALMDLIERQWHEQQEFVAAIKARPIAAVRCDLEHLPSRWQDLRAHGSNSRRLTNGNGSQPHR